MEKASSIRNKQVTIKDKMPSRQPVHLIPPQMELVFLLIFLVLRKSGGREEIVSVIYLAWFESN